ncbi:uncharacterized protein BXZ73DRAFT_86875 [Epithele typhae]|uniref:uncharacterized protein n=1 Tax=Epithele typhae TaxID=378194 RepID=UPI0020073A2F|nr:uncharacterized protein BXZ73DRAFT_86875 [Epithele typhae]KAH9945383.1 hypothetical protein BXZ73DRAFT_86875 [Epithele typhae]
MPILPPELQDYILDFLAADKPTLRQCALTSRNWLPRVQHLLFRSIYIDWSNCNTFTRLLDAHPDLAIHIATLEIEGAFGIFSNDRLHNATLDAWFRALPPSFPTQLSNLTKLELALVSLDAELIHGVLSRFPNVSHLSLWACKLSGFALFIDLFISLARLTCLSISFTHEWETGARPLPLIPLVAADSTPLPALTTVELSSDCDNFFVLRWLIARRLHHSIVHLSCAGVPWPSLYSLAEVLAVLAPTLRTLRIGFRDHHGPAANLAVEPAPAPVAPAGGGVGGATRSDGPGGRSSGDSRGAFIPLTALESFTLDVHTTRLAAVPYTLFLLARLPAPALRTLAFAVYCGEANTAALVPWPRLAEAAAGVARARAPLERVVVRVLEREREGGALFESTFPPRAQPAVDLAEMEGAARAAFGAQGLDGLVAFEQGKYSDIGQQWC